ncbi:MAG: hypothetical protein NC548_35215 [Lachnospiraceae bacterium]|nr:hypothetical protein [Lachnospiraceae bacterium]
MAVVDNFPPGETFDLPSEVRKGKNLAFSHAGMLLKTRIGDTIMPYQSLIGKYSRALGKYIVDYTLTEDEWKRYYQKPKMFCMDKYGTPELWSGLLYINNMRSVVNFTKRSIKVFTQDIRTAINEIITIYQPDIEMNKREVYQDMED